MAAPSTPNNFYVQTGNQQILLTWNLVAGALTYDIQRSVDNITFSSVATPAINSYLDTAVTLGTQYYYKIAAVNGSGTSIYTAVQSAVPTPTGEMTLGQIRLAAQQRADRVNSNFVTLPEWNQMINQSYFELYDLLVTTFEDYFMAPAASFTTDGVTTLYPLPNGTNLSGAAPFYKLLGVDLAVNTASNAYVSVGKFNFVDRNRYVYPNTASTIYGVFNMQYRVMGSNIELIPTPSSGQSIRLWYVPRITQLLADNDTTTDSISGWIEYVIVDAAIKALQKEESDVSVLMAQKQMLIKRITDSAMNRDAGQPDTISDTSSSWGWNSRQGWGGPIGGY